MNVYYFYVVGFVSIVILRHCYGMGPGVRWRQARPDAVMEQVEGTSPGVPCRFPFLFDGALYWGCTEVGSPDYPWCATTFNFDEDKLFGYCRPKNCVLGERLVAYGGDKMTTKDGLLCSNWSIAPEDNTIKDHVFDVGYTIVDVANHCRNPNKDVKSGPYCFVDGKLESCDVPICDDCSKNLLSNLASTVKPTVDITSSSLALSTPNEIHSTAHSVFGYVPSESEVGAWCAETNDMNQWIQVDLKKIYKVVGVVLQGRKDKDAWVTEFKVSYSVDGLAWETAKVNKNENIFVGNADRNLPVAYFLPEEVYTRVVRLLPTKWFNMICLRFDVAGCQDVDDCASIPCQHGGTCTDLTNYFECACTPDRTGTQCEIDYDECLSNPCLNAGKCLNLPNAFNCTCFGNYHGVQCELGYHEHCESVARAGMTESGFYSIWLYEDDSPCVMVEQIQGASSDQPWKDYNMPDELTCAETCLNDTGCISVTFLYSKSMCQLYNKTVQTREAKAKHFNKECPGIQILFCNMTDPTLPVTHISHDRPGITTLQGKSQAFSHRTSITYWPITDLQIEKLKSDSIRCKQTVVWECLDSYPYTSAIIFNDMERHIIERYGREPCRCLFSDSCDTTTGTRCQCTGVGSEWQLDYGTFTNNTLLPVRAVFAGDIGNKYPTKKEGIKYQVSDLLCQQSTMDIDECQPNPCRNGGTCNDERYSYSCICLPGYEGLDCKIEINECLSNPCQYGGACVDFKNGYTCKCKLGFSGSHCEKAFDECASTPCYNGASCINEANRWQCACWPGFEGKACEIDTDECKSSPCANGGTCSDLTASFSCECPNGYDQPRCIDETIECLSSPCLHEGTCVDQMAAYRCECPEGYYGDHCQLDKDECESSPCQEGGTCEDFPGAYSCTCAPGFTGTSCQINIDDCMRHLCLNGGLCVDGIQNYTCGCTPGFTGTFCRTEIAECDSSPCYNDGWCEEGVAEYTCLCKPGYTGLHCETNINECSSWPCLNGGTCIDEVTSYQCQCFDGYSGARCQQVKVAGGWGDWASWGNCSVQCGRGARTRLRTCDSPFPQFDGAVCEGRPSEAELCIADTCEDLDGRWGSWAPWSRCSVTCGTGITVKRRLCDSPAPTGKGADCMGNNSTASSCKDRKCGDKVDGAWSEWRAWGRCTKTCGVGTKRRRRRCNQPAPAYGGKDCVGRTTKVAPCLTQPCPEESTCKDWGPWTFCSASCGDGQRRRNRTCEYVIEPESSTTTGQSWKEWEIEHCQHLPCYVTECFTCSHELSGEESDFRCWGPRMVCPESAPFCSVSFYRTNSTAGRLEKGCATAKECSGNQTETCQALTRQTIDAIISPRGQWFTPLAPHQDTVLRLWAQLETDTECRICCHRAGCNRGLLPPGNALFTGMAGPRNSPPIGLMVHGLFMSVIVIRLV